MDLIQHPEVLGSREITAEVVRMIVDRKIVCTIICNAITDEAWQWQRKQREDARKRLTVADDSEGARRAPLTTAEIRRRIQQTGIPNPASVLKGNVETRRHNAEKLIGAGCITTVGTD